ncbi:MAG: energy transducer TonB [Muribaculaceae bacterium]|nr:energy transducer TonB [Muribaculaceae bacterium]
MKPGKRICETLKAIRSEIASANDIEYTPIKCNHKGDCAGTCPACESETRWLERQLRIRQALGKAVTIAGVSVALTIAASAATPSSLDQCNKKGKQRQNTNQEAQTDGYIQVQRQQLVTSDTIANIKDDRREVRTMGMVRRYIPHPDSIYTNVEVEAFFPGGEEALDSIIRDQLYIPDEILEPIREIGGTVKARCIVKALIEHDGTVSDAVIEKSTTAPLFDEEALSVVKNLPKFIPATIDDMPVRSWKLIPVEFIYDFSKRENEN